MPFAYLAIGLLIMVGIVYLFRWFTAADPGVIARLLKWLAIGVGAVVVVVLALSARLGLLLMAGSVAAPFVYRWWIARRRQQAAAGPSGGRSSRVDTAYVSMVLDHDSGTLDGSVLAGRFAGRRLPDLSLDELMDLLAECRTADLQAVPILEAYLDRAHPKDWRQRAEARARQDSGPAGRPSGMSREEAYEILGLAPGASSEDIKEAHHRLMLKIHPDHGGSTYLAAKINQAKDLLLGA